MNTIIWLITAASLLQGISCAKKSATSTKPPPPPYPKNAEIVEGIISLHPDSLPDEFNEMDMDDYMKLLSEYLDTKQPAPSTPNPTTPTSPPAPPAVSTTPTPPPIATKPKEISSNNKQPVPSTPKPTVTASPPTTSTSSPTTIKSNKISIATGDKNAPLPPITPNTRGLAPNINQKIFSYREGKTALITADGTLKIGGKIIYKNLPELKPNAGYSIREQGGTLSVNGKVVFKNDPQLQFKIPRNVATDFKSDINRLKITVLDDGTLKCVDNNNNVQTF